MRYAAREGGFLFVTPPAQLSDAIVDELVAGLEQHLQSGDPYVLVFDLTTAGVPNAIQRRKLAEHMVIHDAAIRSWVRGLAIVAPNPLVRGMVTALFWLAPPPVVYNLCGTRAEATDWGRRVL